MSYQHCVSSAVLFGMILLLWGHWKGLKTLLLIAREVGNPYWHLVCGVQGFCNFLCTDPVLRWKCEKDLMMLQFRKPIICSFIVSSAGDKMSPTPSECTFPWPWLTETQRVGGDLIRSYASEATHICGVGRFPHSWITKMASLVTELRNSLFFF